MHQGGRIYVFGGRSNETRPKEQAGSNAPAVDFVSFLDLKNMKWGELASLPSPRVGMKGAVIGSKIYIAGGNYSGKLLNSVDCYDPDTNTWTGAGNLSAARMAHAVAADGDVLYVVGGSLNIPKSADDIRLSGSIEAVSFARNDAGK